MPIIETLGLPTEHVRALSGEMLKELAAASATPLEYFSLWAAPHKSFVAGEESVPSVLVRVQMFERPSAVKADMAAIITAHLKACGYEAVDVIFQTLNKNDYYENGELFG